MTRSHRDDGDDEQDPDDDRPGTHIDIGLSVTDLLSDLLEGADRTDRTDRTDRPGSDRPRGRPGGRRPSSPRGGAAGRGTDGEEYHVDGRRTDGGLTVVADLPGADRRDVTAGIDARRNRLVVGVGDRVAGRVSLPWDPVEVEDASFNNGVLRIRLRPAGETPR